MLSLDLSATAGKGTAKARNREVEREEIAFVHPSRFPSRHRDFAVLNFFGPGTWARHPCHLFVILALEDIGVKKDVDLPRDGRYWITVQRTATGLDTMKSTRSHRTGITFIYTAFMLCVLSGFASLAVDWGSVAAMSIPATSNPWLAGSPAGTVANPVNPHNVGTVRLVK